MNDFKTDSKAVSFFLKPVLVLAFCIAGACICGAGTADSLHTAPAGKKRFADSSDMEFQMRASYAVENRLGEKPSGGFRMDNFRWNIEGTAGKSFYYHFRQSFNTLFKSNSFDNILSSIDYAYLTWKTSERFSLTAGKQVFALGGQEFWAAPVYVMQFSDFGGSLPPYQMGLSGVWNMTPTQELVLQVSNLRGGTDEEYYFAGLPAGVESTRFPLFCTVNWNGSFLENNALEFRYSASYGHQAERQDLWLLTLGQSYKRRTWGAYLDLLYSRQGLDANGVLSSSVIPSAQMPAATLRNVEYLSLVAYVHFFISPSFSAFVKASGETAGLYSGNSVMSGICRVSHNAQACIEYMPTKDRDFRLFAHYNYYNASPVANRYALDAASRGDHRISLGVIYIMKVF